MAQKRQTCGQSGASASRATRWRNNLRSAEPAAAQALWPVARGRLIRTRASDCASRAADKATCGLVAAVPRPRHHSPMTSEVLLAGPRIKSVVIPFGHVALNLVNVRDANHISRIARSIPGSACGVMAWRVSDLEYAQEDYGMGVAANAPPSRSSNRDRLRVDLRFDFVANTPKETNRVARHFRGI